MSTQRSPEYRILHRANTESNLGVEKVGNLQRPNFSFCRKHSSGDLHSRLKTRKLLGVGETNDGDVHRSKLSQILGHSEQLYVKLPRGLRVWQFVTTSLFVIVSLWAFVFPVNFYCSLTSLSTVDPVVTVPLRLYAIAMLSFAVFSWSHFRSIDKDAIRISMFACIVYFSLHSLVLAVELVKSMSSVCASCLVFCYLIIYSGYYLQGKLGQGRSPYTPFQISLPNANHQDDNDKKKL